MTPAIAILAAGRASRFGGGKLDAPCAGRPLGRWVLEAVAAAGVAPGMLIVGPDAPAFARDAMADGWTLLANPAPEDGLGGSVALAARHAECLRAPALLLMLADMPLIGPDDILALLTHQPPAQPIAVRHPDGRPGVPARFPAAMFGDLAALNGDRGATVLLRDRADVRLLDIPSDRLIDVDDREGLARAETVLLR